MTFQMKMNEERKEGRKEGKLDTLLDNVRSLMKNMNLSAEQALQALNVSDADRKIVLAGLN